MVRERFFSIIKELGLSLDIKSEFEEIAKKIAGGASTDYAASRGEYLSAKIVAEALELIVTEGKDRAMTEINSR